MGRHDGGCSGFPDALLALVDVAVRCNRGAGDSGRSMLVKLRRGISTVAQTNQQTPILRNVERSRGERTALKARRSTENLRAKVNAGPFARPVVKYGMLLD